MKNNFRYDVFLSHNKADKPWVRDLYSLLEEQGLKVFFDEESIVFGDDTVQALDRALDESRHILLVITPKSMASRWVALETSVSIYADPNAAAKKLIPVLLERTPPKQVPASVRRLNIVDLTDLNNRTTQLKKLLKQLGISSADALDLPVWPSGGEESSCIIRVRSGDSSNVRPSVTKVHLGVSDTIPKMYPIVRENAIDECIFLHGMPDARNRPISLTQDFVVFKFQPDFFTPADELQRLRDAKLQVFERENEFPAPRLCLREIDVDSSDHLSYGALHITAQLTDWCLVHSIQESMRSPSGSSGEAIQSGFWRSINSLVGCKRSDRFPHHLSTHCLLISSDGRLVLNKRVGVSNQKNRISASFEEQIQVACVYPPFGGKHWRFIDGDESPFHAIVRGAKEELGTDLPIENIRLMAFCMEASSIAANLLAIAHSPQTLEEIYSTKKSAIDKEENSMIPPAMSPPWTIEAMIPLLKESIIFQKHAAFEGRWHASSRARILLGLIHDFGYDSIAARVSWGNSQ
jgi:hypothetical protein